MNNSVLKKVILLLSIVLFIFSLSACETIKAAVSFKWGKRTKCEHHLEAKKATSLTFFSAKNLTKTAFVPIFRLV